MNNNNKKKSNFATSEENQEFDLPKEEILRLHRNLGKVFNKKLAGETMTAKEIIAFEEVLSFLKRMIAASEKQEDNYDEFH